MLIIASGMSFHNLQNFFGADARASSVAEKFDAWLTGAATAPIRPSARLRWSGWEQATGARFSHPYEDHLVPLMVAAGAAGEDRGLRDYADHVFGLPVSGYRFG